MVVAAAAVLSGGGAVCSAVIACDAVCILGVLILL
jgi:hypothetical protein